MITVVHTTPVNLRVDKRAEPLGITMMEQLRFEWVVQSPGHGMMQTAWQIKRGPFSGQDSAG